jgi:hypothetical protein
MNSGDSVQNILKKAICSERNWYHVKHSIRRGTIQANERPQKARVNFPAMKALHLNLEKSQLIAETSQNEEQKGTFFIPIDHKQEPSAKTSTPLDTKYILNGRTIPIQTKSKKSPVYSSGCSSARGSFVKSYSKSVSFSKYL